MTISSANFGDIEDFKFTDTVPGSTWNTFVYNDARDELGIRDSSGITFYDDFNEFLEAAMVAYGGEFTNNNFGTSVEAVQVTDNEAEINYAFKPSDASIIKLDDHFGGYEGITLMDFGTEDVASQFMDLLTVLDNADFI